MKNRDQKSKNRSRPQTGRSKTGQKSKNASPRNKVIRLDSPHPNQDIVSSPRQTPPSQNKGPFGPDRSYVPDEEIVHNHSIEHFIHNGKVFLCSVHLVSPFPPFTVITIRHFNARIEAG